MDWYNGSSVINAQRPINFVLGNRSQGKSFFYKLYAIRQYLRKKRRFIYIRRTKEELDLTIQSFGKDVMEKYPTGTIIVKKREIKISFKADAKEKDYETIGYCFSLAETVKIKSIPLDDVDLIIFDEFLPDDDRYLRPNNPQFEPERILSLYLTVARGYGRAIRPEVQLICISNSVSKYNPYFTYFNIDGEKQKLKTKGIYYENIVNTEVIKEIMNTPIGDVLAGTNYGDFALQNKYLVNYDVNIRKRPERALTIMYIYIYEWYRVSVALNSCYIDKGYDKTHKSQYQYTNSITGVPIFRGEPYKAIKSYYDNGTLYYADGGIQKIFMGVFH